MMPLSVVLSPDSSKSTFSKIKPGRFFPNYPNSGGLYSVIPEQLESRLGPFHTVCFEMGYVSHPHTPRQKRAEWTLEPGSV